MHVELQVALNFIISYLYNKLPRTRIHLYGEELEKLLRLKFQGHWYPSNPVKGSAFRCVQLNSTEIDPSFELAAVRSGLDFVNDIKNNLPSELSVWVDPGEVSYAIGGPDGKPGAIKVLYRPQMNAGETEGQQQQNESHDFSNGVQMPSSLNSTSFMTFNPHAKDFLPKSPAGVRTDPVFSNAHSFASNGMMPPAKRPPTLNYNLRPQRRLYTVDEFASTKFGSTKLKSSGRNVMAPPYQWMPQNGGFSAPAQRYPTDSPTKQNAGFGNMMNYAPESPTSPIDYNMHPLLCDQSRPSSLTTSSSFSESSSSSSTSSSPDHIKNQMSKNAGLPHPSSPTSPWGDTFSLPNQSYQSGSDTWPLEHLNRMPSPHDDFLDFTGMRNFNPFSSESVSHPSASNRIMSMAK